MNLELTDEQVALRDTVRRFLAEKASVAGYVRPTAGRRDRNHRGRLAGSRRFGHHRLTRAGGIRRCRHDDGGGRHRLEDSARGCILGRGCPLPSPRLAHSCDSAWTARGGTAFTGIANGSTTATVGPLDGVRPSVVGLGNNVALRGEVDSVWDAAAADLILVLADDLTAQGFSPSRPRNPASTSRRKPESIRRASSSASGSTTRPRSVWPRHHRTPSKR